LRQRLVAVELPERAHRLDLLRAVIGTPRPSTAIVPERIGSIVEARYERVVTPIIDRAWLPVEDRGNRERFVRKSRFIARTYASSS
jgi:hypothetical protein